MKIDKCDWLFLLPLAIACLLAFYRFPLLQLDDHLSVIREISRTWSWPAPDEPGMRMANHPLFHHTLAALAIRGAELVRGGPALYTKRAAQGLSLLYALGVISLVAVIVRRLVADPDARGTAFLVFGSFTGFVVISVTVSNDMAFAFWGTAALLQTIQIMRDPDPPAYSRVVVLGVLLGVAALMKMTAPAMLVAAALCLLARRWYYRERWRAILNRAAVLSLVCFVFYAPSIIRFPRTLGVNPIEFTHRERLDDHPRESDLFSFPLVPIFQRPFQVEPRASEFINRADRSFWASMFLSNWVPPVHLPHPPDPNVTALFLATALLMTFCGIFGLASAVRASPARPDCFVVSIWPLLYILVWFTANIFFYQPGSHVRHLLFSIGSQVAFVALGFQALIRRRPGLKTPLWILAGLHLALFWLVMFWGPFYYFHSPWPNLTAP